MNQACHRGGQSIVWGVFAVWLLGGVTSASAAETAPPDAAGNAYHLVWADEFDEDGPPNPKLWTFEEGFVRNHESQWYQAENAHCEGGCLIIEARRERLKNPGHDANNPEWKYQREFAEYTSASLTTRQLHDWTYGRFEARIKIDVRDGLWPAFWTVGATGAWPSCGEIDIMEYYRGMLKANVGWSGRDRRAGATWSTGQMKLKELAADWAKDFHIWRLDWDERSVRIYLDDQMLNETDLRDTINVTRRRNNPFHAAQYLILNLAVGGTEGGNPTATEFPARMEVDYVRVYQAAKSDEKK